MPIKINFVAYVEVSMISLMRLIKSSVNRLLNNLTQALQSAGLDLSKANISVQIDLGKRANKDPSGTASSPKVYRMAFCLD